jgi:hypothetical protein
MENTSRETLKSYGFAEDVLIQWSDEECKEQLEAVEMYPEG